MFVSTGSTNGCRDPYPELVEGYPELVEGDGCLFMTYRIEAETILDIGEVILKVLLSSTLLSYLISPERAEYINTG